MIFVHLFGGAAANTGAGTFLQPLRSSFSSFAQLASAAMSPVTCRQKGSASSPRGAGAGGDGGEMCAPAVTSDSPGTTTNNNNNNNFDNDNNNLLITIIVIIIRKFGP